MCTRSSVRSSRKVALTAARDRCNEATTIMAITTTPTPTITVTCGTGTAMADGAARLSTEPTIDGEISLDPRLMIWLSPAFPVGAFAYSHGLELATERGWIRDLGSLQAWLEAIVMHGSLRNDVVLLAEAWRRMDTGRSGDLVEVNQLALALQPSAERHLETVTQGNAFMATTRAAWRVAGMDALDAALTGEVAYPIAVGAVAAAQACPLAPTALGYAMAFVGNLVSAAIRLSVIGQTDGQRLTAVMLPHLVRLARWSVASTLDDLGGCGFRADLASLAHETQYSRLFRS